MSWASDDALRAERTPLRLQLGADAIPSVRDHAEALLADLTLWGAKGGDVKIEESRAA